MADTQFNPLFDKKRPSGKLEVFAHLDSIETVSDVMSPITGKPMEAAFCGDIPVMVDLETRVVLPVKEQ